MPKGRHLKPDFFTDAKIVSVSPLARLLYQGLWCYADDCGHVDYEPLEVKIRILPGDNCDVEELLEELVQTGQVIRQENVLYLPKLRAHARIDKRYETVCETCKTRRDHDVSMPRDNPNSNTNTQGSRREHDVNTTSTRRVHVDDGDGDGDGDGDKPSCSSPDGESGSDLDAEFAQWWLSYPRRVGKGQALRAFRTARKKTTLAVMLQAVADQRPVLTARGERFCPHPATWLNGERWADEPPGNVTRLPVTPDGAPILPPPITKDYL